MPTTHATSLSAIQRATSRKCELVCSIEPPVSSTISRSSPISPEWTTSRTLFQNGDQRRSVPTTVLTPARFAASIIRSASASEQASGFSQKMPWTPAWAAAQTISQCSGQCVVTLTMSGSISASIS